MGDMGGCYRALQLTLVIQASSMIRYLSLGFSVIAILPALIYSPVALSESILVARDTSGVYISAEISCITPPTPAADPNNGEVANILLQFESYFQKAKLPSADLTMFFFEPDGSRAFYLTKMKPRGYPAKKYAGADNMKPFIICKWGAERWVGFRYDVGGKQRTWREDFVCEGNVCQVIENKDFAKSDIHLSEVAYKALIESIQNKSAQNGNYGVLSTQVGADIVVRSDRVPGDLSFPIRLSITPRMLPEKKIQQKDAGRERESELDRAVKTATMSFITKLRSAQANPIESQKILTSSDFEYDKGSTIPVFEWEGDRATLVSVDFNGFLIWISKMSDFRVVGYLADSEFVYALVSGNDHGGSGLGVLTFRRHLDKIGKMVINGLMTPSWQVLSQPLVIEEIYRKYLAYLGHQDGRK